MKKIIALALIFLTLSCNTFSKKNETREENIAVSNETPFVWEAANIYFLLIDRFNNGDKSNDVNFHRNSGISIS